jgi:crotonobetainyl-CoA:carnitine CoA-transferase CaiB-like acyl-CoA transferase
VAALLDGIRVLELGEMVAAPYAGMLLADMGAEVLKVEPPGGDPARRHGPFPGDVPDPEKSGLFAYLNRNKRSVTLDVETPTGLALLHELLGGCDVLVENLGNDRWRRIGIDRRSLLESHPRLILAAITPFGLTGPRADWKAYDETAGSYAGLTLYTGLPGREPLYLPFFLCQYPAGIAAGIGALVALHARRRFGVGQLIDVSAVDVLVTAHVGLSTAQFLFAGRTFQREGRRHAGGPYPFTILPCKDGDFRLIAMTKREWLRFVQLMGAPEWTSDPRFQDRLKMQELYADELDRLITAWLLQYGKQELFQMCYDAQVPFTPMKRIDEVLDDPQLQARGFFRETQHPRLGRLRYPGSPYKLRNAAVDDGRPAPRLGEHNDAVFRERLGRSTSELVALAQLGVI